VKYLVEELMLPPTEKALNSLAIYATIVCLNAKTFV
jgi:hypothetical protein